MHRFLVFVALCAATIGLMIERPTGASAGGMMLGQDEQQNVPSYFGFAQDAHGTFLNGVKVTVKLKNISLVAHTDPLGAYKIPIANTEAEANLSCGKEGYRQTGTLRRTPAGVDEKTPVEIDCTLERE
jgi:hypothetical protein